MSSTLRACTATASAHAPAPVPQQQQAARSLLRVVDRTDVPTYWIRIITDYAPLYDPLARFLLELAYETIWSRGSLGGRLFAFARQEALPAGIKVRAWSQSNS